MAQINPSHFFTLCSLMLLFHGCVAQYLGSEQGFFWQNLKMQQQHRLRPRTDCRIDRLTADEPTIRYESDGGITEFWDRNNKPQFQCAGIAAVKNIIQPKGLLLPHYNNAPQLIYIIKGKGVQGTVIPGCAETFEYDTQPRSDPKRRFADRHQKVWRFKEGDVIALPTGFTNWFYNDGEEPIVTVAILDTSNEANQLGLNFRDFYLAGKPSAGRQSYYARREGEEEKQGQTNNIFYGFDDEILSEAFNVDRETARRLKGEDDRRGRIVRVEKFNVVFPREKEEEEESERGRWGVPNGLEETLCTARRIENIGNPKHTDVYNPRGGRLTTLNSQKLPMLRWLKLSAEKGVLYRNAMMAPHWNVNAHSIIYITKGSGWFQVVGSSGKTVFDGDVREGQLIIVPQNFVVVKKASEDQGLEWIAFKTNDNAITSQLAGRLSAIRAMPEEVLMNSYGISRQDARNLKYKREESIMLSGSRGGYQRRPKAKVVEYALDVIKSMM